MWKKRASLNVSLTGVRQVLIVPGILAISVSSKSVAVSKLSVLQRRSAAVRGPA
jgi:hypothetical protein